MRPTIRRFKFYNFKFDLLGQPLPQISTAKRTKSSSRFRPARFIVSRRRNKPVGLSGDDYRRARAQAAWAFEALSKIIPAETVDGLDWHWLAEQVESSPKNFLAAASEFAARETKTPLADLLAEAARQEIFPRVVKWTLLDTRRITLVPPGHWLLIEDSAPFRATLAMRNADAKSRIRIHVQSIAVGNRHIACFAPREFSGGSGIDFGTLRRHFAKNFRRHPFSPAAPEPPSAVRHLPAPDDLGFAHQRHRRHGAAVRGFGPREFQIRLRARREPAIRPCRWTATFSSSASASG